ncbi:MAG: sulfurtransferase [Cohaesibacter sp.]|jgi:rhodanese-related sulfurtransferase|nr:sulfurtransferase [Cohaesibacter sp.]
MAKKQIVRQVNHDEAKQLVENGAVLVDVREGMELISRKVPSALHHPLSGLRGSIDTKGANAAIFFCASGARTNSYAHQLAQCVDCDAYMLVGGVHALSRMGVPTEGGGMFKLFGLAAGALLLVGWATGFIPG